MSRIRRRSTTRRAAVGLSLASTLIIVGAQAGTPVASARPLGTEATADCVVPDDSALRARATTTPQGHYPHEAWLATGDGPAAVRSVGAELATRFGTDTKQAPYTTLRRGLIGVTADHYTRQLVVVVDPAVVPVAGLSDRLTARLGATDVGLRVQAGCGSSAKLLDAISVLENRSWSASAKQASYGFYVDPRTSTVRVTFGAADEIAADAVRNQLGAAVTVSYGTPSRRDRLTDGEPHFGGAAIGFLNDRFCSAGFVIRRNSDNVRGGVSAGHCFNNGDSVFSGSEFWGTANGESGFPAFDMIAINSSAETYSNVIHVDPCCPSTRTVTGKADPFVNEQVCVSGFVTRAVCGITITSTNAEFCDVDGCTPGLMFGTKPGSTVGAGGDSGAPVYVRPTGTTAHVRGIEVAGTAADNFYGELVSNVESHLGVTVATS